LVDLFEPHNTL